MSHGSLVSVFIAKPHPQRGALLALKWRLSMCVCVCVGFMLERPHVAAGSSETQSSVLNKANDTSVYMQMRHGRLRDKCSCTSTGNGLNSAVWGQKG